MRFSSSSHHIILRTLFSLLMIMVSGSLYALAGKSTTLSQRLQEAERLRDNSEYHKAFELHKEIAGQYRADMSKEDKMVCLEAMYSCIDDAIGLSDYISAGRYLVLAEEARDSQGIEDDGLEVYYSCLYQTMASQSGNANMMARGYPHALKAFDYAVKTRNSKQLDLSFFHLIGYTHLISYSDNLIPETGYSILDSLSRVYRQQADQQSRDIFLHYYKAAEYLHKDKDPSRSSLEYDSLLAALPHTRSFNSKRATFLIYAAVPKMLSRQYQQAEKYLFEAINLGDSIGRLEYRLIAYRWLQSLYKRMGKTELSEQYDQRQKHLKDSISSFGIAGDIYALDNIKEEKFLHQQISEARYRSRVYQWGTAFVASLLVVVITFLVILRYKNVSLTERARILRQLLRENSAKPKEEPEPKAKYTSSSLTEDEKGDIAAKIQEVLDSDAVFSSEFSLGMLAEKVGRSPRAVSQVINEVFNTNFSSVVNRIRIYEACRRMDSTSYANWSVEGIAESVGYTQRNTFSTNFKKYTGMGIREYRKLSQHEPPSPDSHDTPTPQ